MPINDDNEDKTTPFIRGELPDKPVGATPYRSPGAVATTPAIAGMFGGYAEAKQRKAPRWALPLLTAMVVGHGVFFLTAWVQGIWAIDRLETPTNESSVSIAPPPPPPPPPPPGGKKPQNVDIKRGIL